MNRPFFGFLFVTVKDPNEASSRQADAQIEIEKNANFAMHGIGSMNQTFILAWSKTKQKIKTSEINLKYFGRSGKENLNSETLLPVANQLPRSAGFKQQILFSSLPSILTIDFEGRF